MKGHASDGVPAGGDEAILQIQEATAARKCWRCGCFHDSLRAIEETHRADGSTALHEAIEAANRTLQAVKYDCLGCDVCYPALAINALGVEADACPTEEAQVRDGWPPLPGDYTAIRYLAPVAVCTLTDAEMTGRLASENQLDIAIVGSLQTENLGIERVIRNVLADPNIRFLIVCGPDSRNAIGHLPGQSLVALARNGLDENARIVDAQGRRPVVRNLSREAVEHFRRTVEVVDLVGCTQMDLIRESVRACAERNPGPAQPFEPDTVVQPIEGYVPGKMTPDPSGYFVVYIDRNRGHLSLEHYRKNGALSTIIEGKTAAELYIPSAEKGLVSRLDHAAYLGRELARAERALHSGEDYVQDAAPEQPAPPGSAAGCGCESSDGGRPC